MFESPAATFGAINVDLPHKICVPTQSEKCVARPRLASILHAATQHKLVAISAPPGYGKTSFLIDLAHASALPVCWYTLDTYDRDPWEFLSYLAAAVHKHLPHALAQTIRLLLSRTQTPLQSAVRTFIREMCVLDTRLLLCFDDWHIVDAAPEINDLVAQMIARCPNIQIILASRTNPTLTNLMLLAARRQFMVIDETYLRFTADELAAVIAAEGLPPLTPVQAETLYTRSEGWISGVLLALRAFNDDIPALLASGSSISRSIQCFLVEQVLSQQPTTITNFLCETALLEDLTADLCDDLLERSDSRSILEDIFKQRLFVSEIAPGVLRYHRLFRAFLRHQLKTSNPVRAREIGSRIARHYALQHCWLLALNIYTEIGDLAAVRDLLASSGEELYSQGRLDTIEHALAFLPPTMLDLPLLCLKARIALDRGHIDAAGLLIQQAAASCGATSSPVVQELQAELAYISGRYEVAYLLLEQALDSTNDSVQRGAIRRILGSCLHHLGQSEQAIATLQQALMQERTCGDMSAVAQVQQELAVCYNALGRLEAAAEAGVQAETYWSAKGNLGRRALSRSSLAVTYALMGHYREALQMLDVALVDAREAAIPQYEAATLSSIGDVHADLGLWQSAMSAYNAALLKPSPAYTRHALYIARIRLLVQQQQWTAASQAIEELPETVTQRHAAMLLLLKAKIAADTADVNYGLALATQATDQAVAQGRLPDQIRAWIVRAWLHSRKRSTNYQATLKALSQATLLCDQLGHDAVLIVETRPLRTMIQRLLPDDPRAQSWLTRHETLARLAATLQQVEQRSESEPRSASAPAPHILETPTIRKRAPKVTEQPPKQHAILRATYLGSDQVWVDQRVLNLGQGRPREVLAYLVMHPHGATRTMLYRAIWDEQHPREDCNALNRVMYRLRAALPDEAIITSSRNTYYLNQVTISTESDVTRFHQLLDKSATERDTLCQMSAIMEAIELYRGPFLPVSSKDWCVQLRHQLERRYCQALRQAAEMNERKGAYQRAIDLFHTLLSYDATNIAIHTGIMRCHIALGEPSLAIAQYRALAQVLNDALGICLDRNSEPEQLYQALLLP